QVVIAALAFAVLADLEILPRLRVGGVDAHVVRPGARVLPGAPRDAVLVEREGRVALGPGADVVHRRFRRELAARTHGPLDVAVALAGPHVPPRRGGPARKSVL